MKCRRHCTAVNLVLEGLNLAPFGTVYLFADQFRGQPIPGTVYLFAGWLDLSPDGRGSACIGKARRSFPVSWWGGLTVI